MSIRRTDNSAAGEKIVLVRHFLSWFSGFSSYYWADVPENDDDDFSKWEAEVKAAEMEAEALKHSANSLLGNAVYENTEADPDNRPSTPPDGEEEFTDDDGTTYKWDRGLRAWVPQVCF